MNESEIIDVENKFMANVFAKRSIVITKGKGAKLWDINNNEYIDCMGSYGVALLGHCHPKIVEAVCKQAYNLLSCHASIYNDKRSEFLQKLVNITPEGLNKAFLSNSGAESVECALKLSRKFTGKTEIIALMGGYHGKTMGALSVTWDKKYRLPFFPLIPGIKHVPADNITKIEAAINENTAAVILEPIRGEGGIRLPPEGFLQDLRRLCDKVNILLIFDEVQTGFGRTGKLFACEHWNVVPDIMCLAKPFAGGLPIGITVSKESIMSAFKVGEHSTTFSGNPLICAAGCAALDVLLADKLFNRAELMGEYFKKCLKGLQHKHKSIKEVRGLGLMIGVEMRFDVLNIIIKAAKRGVLIMNAGRNVLRFLPPLVIEKNQINQVINVMDKVLEEEENSR